VVLAEPQKPRLRELELCLDMVVPNEPDITLDKTEDTTSRGWYLEYAEINGRNLLERRCREKQSGCQNLAITCRMCQPRLLYFGVKCNLRFID
jgi:hypothetical protein